MHNSSYYNAWIGVFGTTGTKKLLCAWHVDRAWRTALNEHVKGKPKQVEIYHNLRVLLRENEERDFRLLLQQFLSKIDSTESRFSKYFKDHYCNRLDQWASCFRVKTIVNTNMFLEAFHRTLKVVYMQQKQNRRVDFLLHTLLKIAKDKIFDRVIKLEKGKFTHRVSEINKRHKSASNIGHLSKQIVEKNANTWSVPSETDSSLRYTVKLVIPICNCQLRCSTCKVCIHLYSCTCMDATLHATVCKHVHLVKMTTGTPTETPTNTHLSPNTQTKLDYFSNLLDVDVKEREVAKLRQLLLHKVNNLNILLKNCDHVDALKAAEKNITSAIIALKSLAHIDTNTTLTVKRKIAPNQNSEKQPRFFSTKKKRKVTRLKMNKPSQQEIDMTLSHLQKQEITCCSVCYKEDDDCTEEYINWVQCSSCELWVHEKCAAGGTDSCDYLCKICVPHSSKHT